VFPLRVGIKTSPRVIPMRERDLPQVRRIEEEGGIEVGSATCWERALAVPDSIALVALDGEQGEEHLLGYIHAWLVAEEIQVTTIGVRRDKRRRGVGASLLMSLIEQGRRTGMKTVHLEVREGNEGAISFYRQLGFAVLGRRKGYYYRGRGGDGIMMARGIGE